MNKRTVSVVVALVVVLGVAIWLMSLNKPSEPAGNPSPESLYAFDPSQCPGPTVEMKMTDVYLRGVLENNQPYAAKMNFYACNKPERGDLVLYRFSHHAPPVVRRVFAVGGDEVVVAPDKKLGAWTISLNGEPHAPNGQIYFFGTTEAPPPLVAYLKNHDGKVGEGEVIVLSSFPPGSEDSGSFGAIGLGDIVAKVEVKSAGAQQ